LCGGFVLYWFGRTVLGGIDMGGGEGITRPALFRVETVQGEPYYVGGRKLVPVVRILTFGKARATVGTHRMGGWGSGLVWIKPVALLVEAPEGERRIAITDGTATAMRGTFGVAATIILFLVAIRWLMRRVRKIT
jgi:uncharacterized spore protein YtfJ